MFKNMKRQLKNEKGLTLVELLAVIVILAIVAAIAIPAIGNIITNSKYNAVKSDAINVINSAQLYYLDDPEATGPVTVENLKDAGYLDNPGHFRGDDYVTNATPSAISTAENSGITFATGKAVIFDGATIEGINKDNTKGSKVVNSVTIDENGTVDP